MRGLYRRALTIACCLGAGLAAWAGAPPTGVYRDDPAVVGQLAKLGDGQSLRWETFKIAGDGLDAVGFYRQHGPRVRDYSTKMAYAPDRHTALYCGASHNTPVVNDAWEYHLGSNTWHLLYASDGRMDKIRGYWRVLRGTESLMRRGKPVSDEQKAKYEKARADMRAWYRQHATFERGYLQTRRGGPLYPSHTWDALTYDPRVRRMLWHPGHDGNLRWYAEFAGQDHGGLAARQKPTTKVWMYEPAAGTWAKQVVAEGTPHPPLRGMGATLHYIPDLGKSLYYVAVWNVAPPALEMWTFDARANVWAELRPNGGKTVGELVKAGLSPKGEIGVAYSTRDKKLVALAKSKAWVYDIVRNEWSLLVDDPATQGFHGRSVFVYDTAADAFLLVQPGPETQSRKRSPCIVRELTLARGTWRTVAVDGPPPRKGTWWPPAGYYDPHHNALVTYNTEEIWVYRHRRREGRSAP